MSRRLRRPLNQGNTCGMYVCHCNRLPERVITAAIARCADPKATSTPSAAEILAACHRAPVCGGCFALINEMIAEHTGTEASTMDATVKSETVPADNQRQTARRKRRGGAFARRHRT